VSDFPAQDLECPDPDGCPVAPPEAIAEAVRTTLPSGEKWYRCYPVAWGYDMPSPAGDARFSPFDRTSDGERVRVVYLSRNKTGALLETVFHSVEPGLGRVLVNELRQKNLAHVLTPKALSVLDLRDPALKHLGIERAEVASSSEEHYPCTRRLARAVHDTSAEGIVWHSRQAEFHHRAGRAIEPVEVAVVFDDHAQIGQGGWKLVDDGSQSLVTDSGRDLVDKIANELGVVVIDES
jgi:hypothetical protein